MAVPKGKRSRARRDKRFANKGIKVKALTSCQTCQAVILPHQVCRECGYYKGVKVLRTRQERMQERAQLRREREEKMAAQYGQEAASSKKGKEEAAKE